MPSPGAVRGPIQAYLGIFTVAGKKTLRQAIPSALSPFQSLWIKRLSLETEIRALSALNQQRNKMLEQGKALVKKLNTAISSAEQTIEEREEQLTQAEKAADRKIAGTEQIQTLSARITKINEALAKTKQIIAELAQFLDQSAAARERSALLSSQLGQLRGAREKSQGLIDQIKSEIRQPVLEAQQALEQADRELGPKITEWHRQKGELEQNQAELEREIRESEERLGTLRTGLQEVTAGLTNLSPASSSILSSTYPAETADDLVVLREAERLIKEELLPILEPGSAPYITYAAELEKIKDLVARLTIKEARDQAPAAEKINANKIMRNIVHEYLEGNDPPNFPRKPPMGSQNIDIPASIPRDEVARFITKYASNPAETREEITRLIRRCVTRQKNFRASYLKAAEALFAIMDRAIKSELPLPPLPPEKSAFQTAQEKETIILAGSPKTSWVKHLFTAALTEEGETGLAACQLEDLIHTLHLTKGALAAWQAAQKEDPEDSRIQEKIAHRETAGNRLLSVIQQLAANLASTLEPKLAAIAKELNKEENKVVRRLILAYAIYKPTGKNFFPAGRCPLPHRVDDTDDIREPTAENDTMTAKKLSLFLKRYAETKEAPLQIRSMAGHFVSRQGGLRKLYSQKTEEIFTVLESIAQSTPLPTETTLREILVEGLYSRFSQEELNWLIMPKANGAGFRKIASAEDFYLYVDTYLKDPLACIQAENRVLADFYLTLPRKTRGLWFKTKSDKLTGPGEMRFNQAVRTAILTRVKIEAALFPNGKGPLSAQDMSAEKYEEISGFSFIYQNYLLPPVVSPELGKVYQQVELVAGVNKEAVTSSGDKAVVFNFMLRAKKEAITRLAAGELGHVTQRALLAKSIFQQLNLSYSDRQKPDQSITGQDLTLNFFMQKGGCCRHRALTLQLGYQEAGLPSALYLGYTSYSEHFPKMLSGPHAWVMLDLYQTGKMNHIADPNRQYDPKDKNARFFGMVRATTETEGWEPAEYQDLFDGNAHIFDFGDMSKSYWDITGIPEGSKREEIHFYVAQEKSNFGWRPHPTIDPATLTREVARLKQA